MLSFVTVLLTEPGARICFAAQGYIRVARPCSLTKKTPYGPFVMFGTNPIVPVL
jgi:hypothetical protein